MERPVDKKVLAKALKLLVRWASMEDWEILLEIKPLKDRFGEAEIIAPYKQAVITINPQAYVRFSNDTHLHTLCHEFAHIWLWDLHEPDIYTTNSAYNRLVEGKIEEVGNVLYRQVLVPAGF